MVTVAVCVEPGCPILVDLSSTWCWCFEHLAVCHERPCLHPAHDCDERVHYCDEHREVDG
jgi:hypothetical protein